MNKTSSKATISLEPGEWLNASHCFWIPQPVMDQISKSAIRHQTKSGGILIQSDSSRSRDVNTDECFRKLLEDIKQHVYFAEEVSEADKKKWEDIAFEQREKRMYHKKKNSDKKKLRQRKFDI